MGMGGGKGGGKGAPATPDYASLIPAQEASNMRQYETVLAGQRVNSNGPNGSNRWERGDDGQWTFNQTLSPDQQALQGRHQGITSGMMGEVAATAGQSQAPLQYDAGSRDRAEKALYGRSTRYMDEDYNRRDQQNHERLVSQGFNVSDNGYRNSMDTFNKGRERAYADARDSAVIGGGQEASQELGRGITAGNYNSDQRTRLINQLNSFRTGQQGQLNGAPGQFSSPNLQNVDYLGTANQDYQNRLGQWSAGQGQKDNFMSGLFGLGGAALGAYGNGAFG